MQTMEWNVGNVRSTVGMTYLDSPSTTSATTYQVYFRSNAGGNTSFINFANILTSITVMEIKG